MIFTQGPQKQYKDRLFKAIFGRDTEGSKRWRLDLYNALNGTDYKDPNAIKVNTIENVIYITMHNDVSFLIDDQMVLFEQQSTYNQNMPLRGFLYFSQLYQIYLAETDQDPNRSKRIELPVPKFIVFYNGSTQKEYEHLIWGYEFLRFFACKKCEPSRASKNSLASDSLRRGQLM